MSQMVLEKLSSPQIIANLDQVFSDMVVFDSVGDAKKYIPLLEKIFSGNPEFKKSNPSLFSIYNSYLTIAKFVILFDLGEKEIIQLLRDNFNFDLNHPDYDLDRKIKYKIRDVDNLEQRDAFKEKIRQTLLECNSPLGKKKIIVNGLSQEQTIANWLKSYYVKVGIEPADPLKINEYLINDSNIKLLSSEEKLKLKTILAFFENLKVSSVKSPAFEESFGAILPDGSLAITFNGRLEKIDSEILKIYRGVSAVNERGTTSATATVQSVDITQTQRTTVISSSSELEELQRALQNYPAGSLEHKAISQEISRLKVLELKAAQQSNVKK